MNILAEFTLKENIFVLNVTKQDLLLSLFFISLSSFLTSSAATLFSCKQRQVGDSDSDLVWLSEKGNQHSLVLQTLGFLLPMALLFLQANFTKFLVIVPASNQGAGA